MNVVSKTHEKSMNRAYESPAVSVVLFQPEGVLCDSVTGIGHDDFTGGDSFDL